MKRRTFLALSVAISLIATSCSTSNGVTSPTSVQTPGSSTPTVPSSPANCTAANAQWAVDQPASDELLEKARLAANASVARFLVHGQPITTEYIGSRLNLETDERRIVVLVRCG